MYVHALETLELLGTLETAANPKVIPKRMIPPAACHRRHHTLFHSRPHRHGLNSVGLRTAW